MHHAGARSSCSLPPFTHHRSRAYRIYILDVTGHSVQAKAPCRCKMDVQACLVFFVQQWLALRTWMSEWLLRVSIWFHPHIQAPPAVTLQTEPRSSAAAGKTAVSASMSQRKNMRIAPGAAWVFQPARQPCVGQGRFGKCVVCASVFPRSCGLWFAPLSPRKLGSLSRSE